MASSRSVRPPLPGPRSTAEMARGTFDMQHRYRALVLDDAASEGSWLVDVDGNVFLDLFGNFALGALGYNHPALVAAASTPEFVRASVNPTSTPFVTTPAWFDFMQAMEGRFAPRGMARMYCVDAGGEGVESALKVAFIVHAERARLARGAPADPLALPPEAQAAALDNAGSDAVVVSFSGAFHGRGLGPLSATHSKLMHKADLPAFPWPTVPFPANRFPLAEHAEENARAEAEALAALERTLDRHAGRVAAVLVEPIQSEGGDRHASAAFFQGVQDLAARAGAAFIMDEVQTGVAATGRMWAHEHFALPRPPDLVCFGKKMMMGGFFCGADHDVGRFGRMYQTRNGDRARALLALATLRTIEEQRLVEHAARAGAAMLERLEALARRHPGLVTEPRGRGLLMAFDLPTPALRDDFLRRALHQGVFATYTGSRSVRLRPHLIVTEAQLAEAADVFDRVCAEMSA